MKTNITLDCGISCPDLETEPKFYQYECRAECAADIPNMKKAAILVDFEAQPLHLKDFPACYCGEACKFSSYMTPAEIRRAFNAGPDLHVAARTLKVRKA
jgi:hypothetical protein